MQRANPTLPLFFFSELLEFYCIATHGVGFVKFSDELILDFHQMAKQNQSSSLVITNDRHAEKRGIINPILSFNTALLFLST